MKVNILSLKIKMEFKTIVILVGKIIVMFFLTLYINIEYKFNAILSIYYVYNYHMISSTINSVFNR